MAESSERTTDAGTTDDTASENQVSEILSGWRQRLRGSPDIQPREGLRGQRERALTRALLEAAESRASGESEDEEALRKLAMVAALYGADQPRDRVDPGALCEELGHLRQAVWQHLREAKLEHDAVTERILAFDRALGIALRAALTGGFRCEPDQLPEWSGNVDAIVADTVAPPRPSSSSVARDQRTSERH